MTKCQDLAIYTKEEFLTRCVLYHFLTPSGRLLKNSVKLHVSGWNTCNIQRATCTSSYWYIIFYTLYVQAIM